MDDNQLFRQNGFTARFEWGSEGVEALAPNSDIVVIIDVLSFTTCVDVVVNRKGIVFPYRFRDSSSVNFAARVNAVLAGKRGDSISLSPYSLSKIPEKTRIVLPSPNGATCSFLAKDFSSNVIAGCLRNASSVANYIKPNGKTVSVIASGEKWPNGSLRPAFEDLVAAGAILNELTEYKLSPEANSAVAVFQHAKHDLQGLLESSSSGEELIEKGYLEDVRIASQLNCSTMVPVLNQEGAFVASCLDIN